MAKRKRLKPVRPTESIISKKKETPKTVKKEKANGKSNVQDNSK